MIKKTDKEILAELPTVSYEEWLQKAEKDLKGKGVDSLVWRTGEGFEIPPFFTREHQNSHISDPSKSPYKRGVKSQNNDWLINEGFTHKGDDRNTFDLLNNALEKGTQSLTLDLSRERLDWSEFNELEQHPKRLEVQPGNDPDRALEQFLKLLKDGQGPNEGAFLFDPLGHLTRSGDWYEDEENDLSRLEGIAKRSTEEKAYIHTIPVDGSVFHEGGGTIVEELAFTLSQGVDLLAYMTDKGWKIDDLTPRFKFELSAGSYFFAEIAKFRAFRTLWDKIVSAYEPEHECTSATWVHAKTSSWTLTGRSPYTNIVRKTTEAMAAVIGGCDQLTILPFDNALKENKALSERIARNTHHILKEEAHLNKVIDPVGGSYYLENVTDRIAEAAWDLVREIEDQGGYLKALKKGTIQHQISSSAKRKVEEVENGSRIVVGVNKYQNKNEEKPDLAKESDGAPTNFLDPIKPIRATEKEEQ